jgi:hypothetical protein
MGGQACVFYGAAEFSRDLDLLILAEAANLANLRAALGGLRTDIMAVLRGVGPFEELWARRTTIAVGSDPPAGGTELFRQFR